MPLKPPFSFDDEDEDEVASMHGKPTQLDSAGAVMQRSISIELHPRPVSEEKEDPAFSYRAAADQGA